MAIDHNVRLFPDPVLMDVAEPLTFFNSIDQVILDDVVKHMIEVCDRFDGHALAAPQVGLSKRIVVIGSSKSELAPMVLLNPSYVPNTEPTVLGDESCLSLPGVVVPVSRWSKIAVKYTTMDHEVKLFDAEGLLARVIQHEIDHLDGKLIIDHLSSLKRSMVVNKFMAYKKKTLRRTRHYLKVA